MLGRGRPIGTRCTARARAHTGVQQGEERAGASRSDSSHAARMRRTNGPTAARTRRAGHSPPPPPLSLLPARAEQSSLCRRPQCTRHTPSLSDLLCERLPHLLLHLPHHFPYPFQSFPGRNRLCPDWSLLKFAGAPSHTPTNFLRSFSTQAEPTASTTPPPSSSLAHFFIVVACPLSFRLSRPASAWPAPRRRTPWLHLCVPAVC